MRLVRSPALHWTVVVPVLAAVALALSWGRRSGTGTTSRRWSPAGGAGAAAEHAEPPSTGAALASLAPLVPLPETLAAVRATRRGRVQISLNLALGSAMASIGLTIPAIAVASAWAGGAALLGLGATQLVLLALGRQSPAALHLTGASRVHLALMACFVVLAISPLTAPPPAARAASVPDRARGAPNPVPPRWPRRWARAGSMPTPSGPAASGRTSASPTSTGTARRGRTSRP